jgi:hypothetical protein
LLLAACGKGKSPDAVAPPAAASTPSALAAFAADARDASDDAGDAMDARETAQWAAAKAGEPEELMRLSDLVGCEGLRARASQPELLPTALLAMQYCQDFSELPFLAQVGVEGSDADARSALTAVAVLAARPRRAVDPEDADELHTGCMALLALARSTERPQERRALAIRSLRMLSEYGCVKRADLPTDLDAR